MVKSQFESIFGPVPTIIIVPRVWMAFCHVLTYKEL